MMDLVTIVASLCAGKEPELFEEEAEPYPSFPAGHTAMADVDVARRIGGAATSGCHDVAAAHAAARVRAGRAP